jgi:hypothetical protein
LLLTSTPRKTGCRPRYCTGSSSIEGGCSDVCLWTSTISGQ